MEPLTRDDPGQIAGYRLRARLGAGGMGVVYLAPGRGGQPCAPERVAVAVQPRALEIAQTYALRAWTTWLQTQISNAQPELERQISEHQRQISEHERQISEHEREIERLRATMDRSSSVLKSLQKTIEQLDGILRDVHDTDIVNAAMQLLASTQQRQVERATSPARGDSSVPDEDARARN